MEILEKIEKIRIEKGWSQYKLALEAGLTQSTLSNMYVRKTLPSLTTLSNICDAFGITLSQFFANEKELGSSLDEEELLINYRKLTEVQKKAVKNLCKELL